MKLVALQVYVPLSPGPRGDIVRDVEVLVDWTLKCDREMRTLPLGVVQVMLGTGRPPKVQFNCTLHRQRTIWWEGLRETCWHYK